MKRGIERDFCSVKQQIEKIELDTSQVKEHCPSMKYLVFEGGGVRGIAFGGVLRFFEEHKLTENVEGWAGSSAGAIVATAIAVGYTAQEIIDILMETDFNRFKDDSWGVVFDIIRLFTQYGIYKGDTFYEWFTKLVEKKTGNGKITFRELHERTGKTLVLTGTCLNKAKTYFFNHSNPEFADMPVALAVRISMSIPLFWKAVRLGDDVMVDGGVLNNYPIWVFDGKYIGDTDVNEEQVHCSQTIGFKLMTSNERPDSTLYHVDNKIDGPVDYAKAFIDAQLIEIERGHIRSGYWERTVCINTHEISSLMFDITAEQKEMLVHEGYIATKNYFHCRIEGKTNEMNKLIIN